MNNIFKIIKPDYHLRYDIIIALRNAHYNCFFNNSFKNTAKNRFFLHVRQVKQTKDLQKDTPSINNVMNPQKTSLF